jgi:HEAT repeat protein
VAQHVEAVTAPDPVVRAQALTLLPKHGRTAAVAIVQAIRRRAAHPEEMPDYVDALAAIGRAAVPAILDLLEHLDELSHKDALTCALHLLEALERIADRSAGPVVARFLDRLRKSAPKEAPPDWQERAEMVRVRAHAVMAELGDASALDDLLQLLGDGTHRVRAGVVEALARIGDRRALVPLLRLFQRELPVSGASAQEVKEAFRAIVRRANVAADDAVFASLTAEERAVLERLHPNLRKNGKSG